MSVPPMLASGGSDYLEQLSQVLSPEWENGTRFEVVKDKACKSIMVISLSCVAEWCS